MHGATRTRSGPSSTHRPPTPRRGAPGTSSASRAPPTRPRGCALDVCTDHRAATTAPRRRPRRRPRRAPTPSHRTGRAHRRRSCAVEAAAGPSTTCALGGFLPRRATPTPSCGGQRDQAAQRPGRLRRRRPVKLSIAPPGLIIDPRSRASASSRARSCLATSSCGACSSSAPTTPPACSPSTSPGRGAVRRADEPARRQPRAHNTRA
jgi:hypothetical protein